jgi:neuroligin
MIWIVSLVLILSLHIRTTTAPASFTTTTTHHLSAVILSSSLVTAMKWSPRHVDTKYGVAQGFVVYPKEGFDGVEVLLNMPYASSPIGNLRFMPPVTAPPWSGVRKSDSPGAVCPQVLPDIRNETEALKNMPKGKLQHLRRLLPHLKNQSEDCLYLNLYIPLKGKPIINIM